MTEPIVAQTSKKYQPHYSNRKYNIDDFIGKKYGWLTIIKKVDPIITSKGYRKRAVLCRCKCGAEVVVQFLNVLYANNTTSCGCKRTERIVKLNKTHGLRNHTLYRVWRHMKERCSNPNDKGYKNYGGRGITVCDEWLEDFQNFYDWAIKHWKKGLIFDRKDVNGEYSESNCRFIDRGLSARNVRLLTRSNKTGYRGIYKVKNGRWAAAIRCNNKPNYLGRFDTAIEAAKAYDAKAIELNAGHPLNFPERT